MKSALNDKDALKLWEEYREQLISSTPVDLHESPVDKEKRIRRLKSDFTAFCQYYFPRYCSSPFGDFHKDVAKHIVANEVTFTSFNAARDHAKSILCDLFLPLYLMVNDQLENMILCSSTEGNAIRLITPLRINLESNQRLIHDYGKFAGKYTWTENEFTTNDRCNFLCLGKGQSPRVARKDAARPDYIVCDDIDDDEAVLNAERIDKDWNWLIGSLYGTFSLTGRKRFIVANNIIAPDSLAVRAQEQSDKVFIVNLLTKTGVVNRAEINRLKAELKQEKDDKKQRVLSDSIRYYENGYEVTWHQKITMKEAVYMIHKMGILSEREYFNNPQIKGKIFLEEWLQFDKMPKLNQFKYLVQYLDPGFMKSKSSDTKSLVLIGLLNAKYYLIKVYCGQATINEMIEWCYQMDAYVKRNGGSAPLKMEEVFLQSLLYKDFSAVAKEKGYAVPVSGDTRKKPDKDSRIMATAGYFERGDVFINEEERHNHHMKQWTQQYTFFRPGSTKVKKDGLDAFEGGIHILNQLVVSTGGISYGRRVKSSKYF
jgi:phage terminase large subunit-like protein